eukprot:TRINITY_DN91968_c0_g1_i1.p1 TRINITY_DN91968_c0_g1~~TRINITY_DN91968_c0_g1_i1.p1  ORF type:complete len:224 (-),score=23.04 TRINITY_DN91968_c0_g1_i1:228-812(-)
MSQLDNWLGGSETNALKTMSSTHSFGSTAGSRLNPTRYVAGRVSQSYDQAVNATHEWTNGVMRSQLDCWRVPKTAPRQRILHSTSSIVDTGVRQKAARFLNDWVSENGTGNVHHAAKKGPYATLKMDQRGHWVPERCLARSCSSLPEEAPPWSVNKWATSSQGPAAWAAASQHRPHTGLSVRSKASSTGSLSRR